MTRFSPSFRLLAALALAGVVANPGVLGATVGEPQRFVFHHENVLGTSCELRVRTRDAATAARAEAAALAEIDRLARLLSSYSPDSEFSRWQASRDAPVAVSPELFAVLAASDRWRMASDGAFNPTAETFSRLWKSAAARGELPSSADLADGIRRAGVPAFRLDLGAHTATHLSACPLSLNAIAKGYIIEQASAAAWQAMSHDGNDDRDGRDGLLLEIGGDLRVRGQVAEPVAVADPRHDAENAAALVTVEVRDGALTTSGNYRRGFDVGGRHYSHIIDPRTGEPAGQVLGATVLAPDTTTADALSTTFSVLNPEASLRLADATPGVSCLLVLADGRVAHSAHWPSAAPTFAAGDGPPAAPAAGSAAGAGEPLELAVNFEVGRSDEERYRRPYVAVWVEDADAFPVRTLLLWVLQSPKGARWIPDLRRWRRSDDTRRLADDKDLVATVSGATRSPGSYSVVWDGRDDAGKPVKPGTYTLYFEAAREHGPYSLMRQEFTVGPQPFKTEIKGNEDLKGATLEYRRRTARK